MQGKLPEIKTVKVAELETWKQNPREQLDPERLQELLTKRGQLMPLLLDGRDMKTVLGGNMRLKAMKELGWTECVVSIVIPRDEKDAVEIALEDNDNFGKYVQTQLIELVKEFDIDTRINIDLKPVSIGDIMPIELEAGNIPDDEVPEVKEPISVLGDIYELDGHRVMCGDSTIVDQVQKLMNGKKADMVFTDPPYGVNYASKNEFLNNQDKGNRIQKDIENDTMEIGETSDFIYKCFVNLRLSLAEKSSYYITAPQGGDLLMMMMMQKAGIPLRHMLVWVKNNHVLGRTDYNYKHEPILYGWINTHNFYGKGDWQFSTWEIDKPLKNDLHPTMKPIALMVNAILNSTLKDNIVLDLFGGSGSTLIACEQTNRKCYMMEIDPHYVDVIVNRWSEFTGKYDIIRNGEKVNWRELQNGTR